MGILRWELVACLLCAWILVYFAIWKSIKSSAKARYFTATIPLILIIIFLAKSLTLEGADKGMRYFFKPRLELLADAKVCHCLNEYNRTSNANFLGLGKCNVANFQLNGNRFWFNDLLRKLQQIQQ